MPAIIYEKTPDGLIATGDRNVSTFPSGLCRVDQTFVCKSSMAATHRLTLAIGENFPNGNMPGIDGYLKIYPDVQETQKSDGFTEFKVSAYGRTRSSFSNESIKTEMASVVLNGHRIVDGSVTDVLTDLFYITYSTIEGNIVILRGEELSIYDLNLPEEILNFKGVNQIIKRAGYLMTTPEVKSEQYYDYIDWNGVMRQGRAITYIFYVGNPGTGGEVDINNSLRYSFVYDMPRIKVKHEATYGKFTELSLTLVGKVIGAYIVEE